MGSLALNRQMRGKAKNSLNAGSLAFKGGTHLSTVLTTMLK
jgi:hypothetical protein